MGTDKIREELAALCHEQWSGWMKYLFSKCDSTMPLVLSVLSNGSLVIPVEFVSRWKRQMETPYSKLPENEKDSDRKEADKFIRLLGLESADTKRKVRTVANCKIICDGNRGERLDGDMDKLVEKIIGLEWKFDQLSKVENCHITFWLNEIARSFQIPASLFSLESADTKQKVRNVAKERDN